MNTVKILKLDRKRRSQKKRQKIIKKVENSGGRKERFRLCYSDTRGEKRKMRKREVGLLFHNIFELSALFALFIPNNQLGGRRPTNHK